MTETGAAVTPCPRGHGTVDWKGHPMDTRDLTAVLRDAVLDHLGAESVRVLAETMALPEDVAKALVDNPAWSLDLLARLIGDLGLTVEVRPGSDGPVLEEAEAEPDVAAAEPLTDSLDDTSADAPTPPDAPGPVAVPRPPRNGALYATPPLEKRGGVYGPGDVMPRTGLRYVHLSAHASKRAEEMGISEERITMALQEENILSRRPDADRKARLVESAVEPLLLFVTDNHNDCLVISVLWKSAEPYVRPSCPVQAKKPPTAP